MTPERWLIEALQNAAVTEKAPADNAALPRVRERHPRAAEAWDAMAEVAQETEVRSKTNAQCHIK